MKEKESFILYNSFYEPIKALKNEQLGKLLRAIFDYTINGEITQDNEIIVAFMFIKNQLDRDSEKWEDERNKRKEAGRLGGIKRALNQQQKLSSKSKQCLGVLKSAKQSQANQADNVDVDVYVNVNDNVNVNNNIKEKNKKEKYGEFNNVLLTDEEYAKLDKSNLLPYIERLSSYIASTGKRYKSHYATILNWSRKEKKIADNNPNWLNKQIEESKASTIEIQALEERLKNYKK